MSGYSHYCLACYCVWHIKGLNWATQYVVLSIKITISPSEIDALLATQYTGEAEQLKHICNCLLLDTKQKIHTVLIFRD